MSSYIPVIGLEIHAQLLTQTKIFCSCEVDFGGEQNTRCCPVCAGFPGTLPVLNQEVVKCAIKAGLALGCEINRYSKIDRKNYFYPDLPKAYQISQFDSPVCLSGKVKIEGDKGEKEIRIHHAHIEEDAGKLIHDDIENTSLADYNRCGVPLLEIVSEPDMSSAEEARAYIEKVSGLLQYAGVSLCRMEEGSLRADVNISLKHADAKELGTKVEIKNLNSMKSIVRAIDYEIERQTKLLTTGEPIVQETRKFNDNRGVTVSMRSKEDAHDYRYFKEPDIIPVIITEEDIEKLSKEMPVLIDERMQLYTKEYGLNKADAQIVVNEKGISDFYNDVVMIYPNYKAVANFIVVEILRYVNEGEIQSNHLPFSAEAFATLVKMSEEDIVNKNNAKAILKLMIESQKGPMEIAKEQGYLMNDNTDEIKEVVSSVVSEFTEEVTGYLAGKEKLFGFLMGQCSKRLAGRANPKTIKEILEGELTKLR
ncbi:Asp-tRNA(Asn)/Glu-tRNA(Gln) amidotransferase GatCAB subunit B [Sporanaerobium hydrogeniformans]|uniref:Asp-tRNA(Asn)/Glu-tRNA(Gln) amidotransferase GatCAB subunit B n=1 Tax=Sporanaerobium hydrogeniformans TaxID=3072179 RepID=A0AC61DCE7_9FIRM|nr:Asp-tRNA(Asn)/Glu-tRNA(Gln) amidotransferase subunit GatB [Sporanaerobium hydrogeniformans]PHV70580.1 Asp-tRNA(Asn)/Glu-tRNA(Gln) amidotransferase GatCAB subunit B [Sporanaerobium hydrogeniformans]